MQIGGKGNENLAVRTKFGWEEKNKKDINFNQFFLPSILFGLGNLKNI
jgi:hypothetical protein